VGVLVAVFVGVFVSISVGFFVGVLVAVFVGVLVGFIVGLTVGVLIGFFVGVSARSACTSEDAKTATPNTMNNAIPIKRMNLEGDLVNAWNDLPKRARNDRDTE
jgi:hypothetical protein